MTSISAISISIFVSLLFLRSECVEDSSYLKYLDTLQIIRKHGYTAEAHIIQTADGYLLEYHRIPHGKNMKAATRKYPVLLFHGRLASSADWVKTGPNRSLAYELADNGFDVWLANARGNSYSKSHLKYNPTERHFWNFSFHEMGVYDIPAAIDYILEVTSARKVIYIGHSLGTTVFFVFASTLPEYKDKVLFQISMGPYAAMTHTSPFYLAVLPYMEKIQRVVDEFQNGAFQEFSEWKYSFCKPFPNFCAEMILYSLFGADRKQLNASIIPIITSKFPSGSSIKTMVHLSQITRTGKFRQYDYGKVENVNKYKSETPPPYNISDMRVPTTFFYGRNDLVANPQDVKALYQQLSYPMGLIPIKYEKWNHVDFLFAFEIKKLFFDPLLELVINATTNDSFVKKSVERALVERATEDFADENLTSNESGDESNQSFAKLLQSTLTEWFIKKIEASVIRRQMNEQN